MNESLQQALAGILNKTMAGVEAGVSFLSAELPDVIHQLLLWKMVSSGVFFILTFISVAFFTKACSRAIGVLTEHSRAQNSYVRNVGEKEREARDRMEELGAKIPVAICSIVLTCISWLVMLGGYGHVADLASAEDLPDRVRRVTRQVIHKNPLRRVFFCLWYTDASY